eukprot:scaffold156703_cov15-Tisochrysis_lutea.AAC.1
MLLAKAILGRALSCSPLASSALPGTSSVDGRFLKSLNLLPSGAGAAALHSPFSTTQEAQKAKAEKEAKDKEERKHAQGGGAEKKPSYTYASPGEHGRCCAF